MNKRYLHYLWTRIRPIKTWYLFAAFLVCGLLTVGALRANYAGMVRLRSAVFAADKSGNNTQKALQDLRSYVGSHMNTDLYNGKGVYPPIQLKFTYDRLVKAEQDTVDAANSSIYTDAQKYCETVDPNSFYGRDRVPCIEQYIKSKGTQTAKAIPDALYKFDFFSPRWSPDLAGWLLVLSIALLALTVLRFALGRLLQSITK
ncbi:MAG TPA: hypothetical protein VL737_02245 [Candidatus Pristimantibacillus sp.]|jgi:hypothetical protein|nr:hypothetical protein [Candidatus Pristimantibacillus sp.]